MYISQFVSNFNNIVVIVESHYSIQTISKYFETRILYSFRM